MFQIESRTLSSEDCEILAKITKSARANTPLDSDKTIEEISKNIEELSTDSKYQILLALDEAGCLVGWTYYYIGFPLMAFISGFLPLLDEADQADEIAFSLIEAAKKDIVRRGYSRLEIELLLPTDAHRA
ncbi:MAG: hypothetical protein ACW96N_08130, partial [Candidatus Thorarchaeota archaeon]